MRKDFKLAVCIAAEESVDAKEGEEGSKKASDVVTEVDISVEFVKDGAVPAASGTTPASDAERKSEDEQGVESEESD